MSKPVDKKALFDEGYEKGETLYHVVINRYALNDQVEAAKAYLDGLHLAITECMSDIEVPE